MKREIVRDDFAVIDGTGGATYLGDPSVVRELVDDYVNQVYWWIKLRGNGTMTKDDMAVKLKRLIDENADIIMGKNDLYVPIKGWHSRYALGVAITQVLGKFWTENKDYYEGDQGKVLFAWLAASLVDAAKAALSDPDLAGASINAKKDQVVKLILGIQKRAR